MRVLTPTAASSLRAGHDYPGNYAQLRAWFPDDDACLDYLEWLRWPHGFICPVCETSSGWRMSDGRFWCENDPAVLFLEDFPAVVTLVADAELPRVTVVAQGLRKHEALFRDDHPAGPSSGVRDGSATQGGSAWRLG